MTGGRGGSEPPPRRPARWWTARSRLVATFAFFGVLVLLMAAPERHELLVLPARFTWADSGAHFPTDAPGGTESAVLRLVRRDGVEVWLPPASWTIQMRTLAAISYISPSKPEVPPPRGDPARKRLADEDLTDHVRDLLKGR